jgi:hypothetical protein
MRLRPSLIDEVSILSLRTLRTWQEVTLSAPPSPSVLRAAKVTRGSRNLARAPAIGLLSRLSAASLASLGQRVACGGHPCIREIAPTEVCARQHGGQRERAQHRGGGRLTAWRLGQTMSGFRVPLRSTECNLQGSSKLAGLFLC